MQANKTKKYIYIIHNSLRKLSFMMKHIILLCWIVENSCCEKWVIFYNTFYSWRNDFLKSLSGFKRVYSKFDIIKGIELNIKTYNRTLL